MWLCVAVFGAALLVLILWISAPLAARVGLGSFEQAVVTHRLDTKASYPTRGSCRLYTTYEVSWDSRTGTFGTCTSRAQWEVGDTVEVAVAPWSSEVSAKSADLGWNIVGLPTSVLAVVHGLRASGHYRRLTRGGSGAELRGRVSAIAKTHVTVVPDAHEPDPRRILLMPATTQLRVDVGDPVSIWSSRRGWSGRPRGPWVVRAGDRVSVATHLWRRPARP